MGFGYDFNLDYDLAVFLDEGSAPDPDRLRMGPIVKTLLLLTAGTLVFSRRRPAVA